VSISVVKCNWVKCGEVLQFGVLFLIFFIVEYVVVCFVYFCLILLVMFSYCYDCAFLLLCILCSIYTVKSYQQDFSGYHE
jgi:hypothetical protein